MTCTWSVLKVTYNVELAQFYMWAQTSCTVLLAVFIPTGMLHLATVKRALHGPVEVCAQCELSGSCR